MMAKKSTKKSTKKKAAKKKSAKSVAGSDNPLQDKLQLLLEQPKSEQKVLKLLLSLSEPQRRELAPHCKKWLKAAEHNWSNPLFKSAQVAFFATANIAEIKKMGVKGRVDRATTVSVLKKRKPKWIGQFVDLSLDSVWSWQMVRELVKHNLIKKPADDRYYVGMISQLARNTLDDVRASTETTVLKELKKDPSLLKHDIWRLFEVEGDGENSLANTERFENTDWSAALIELCKKGKLPRKRLLDSAISAMGLGFNHYRSKWFLDFFDKMQPKPVELKSRLDDLLNLMSSPTPNVAKWAFTKVVSLVDQGAVKDKPKLLEKVRPLLMVQQKGMVKAVLKLLQGIATADSKCVKSIPLVAALALGHEKVDVQKSAFKLITKFGDSSDAKLKQALEKYRPVIAASLKKDFNRWLESEGTGNLKKPPRKSSKQAEGKAKQAKPFSLSQLKGFDKEHVELLGLNALLKVQTLGSDCPKIPSATFDGTDIPRLDPSHRLAPINDLEELVDVCARVIENGKLIDEAERAIDAMVRLCDQRPDDFGTATGPLFKRTVKLLKKNAWQLFCGEGLETNFRGLVFAWLKQQPWNRRKGKERYWGKGGKESYRPVDQIEVEGDWIKTKLKKQESILGFLSGYLEDTSEALTRGAARQLLSSSTHSGGWIDPVVFVDRINRITAEPNERELVLALLRLAPDGKAKALKKLKPKLKDSSECIAAVKFALGADKVKLGKSAPLWIAALRSRTPLGDNAKIEKAFPKLGPDCGTSAKYSTEFESRSYNSYGGKKAFHHYLHVGVKEGAKKWPDNLPTRLFNVKQRESVYGSRLYGGISWSSTVWPVARESFFWNGVSSIGYNIDWHEAAWENRDFLAPLLDPRTPLREQALMLLMTGLSAKEPGECGLATDAAIQAISDGRLGTDNLGRWLSEFLQFEFFKCARLAKRFADIASVSGLHAYVIFRACEQALQGDPKKQSRGFTDLVELLVELGTQLGVGVLDQGRREFLNSFKGSNKLAKSAKALLKLENLSDSQDYVAEAIRERVERLKAWKPGS